MKCYVRKARFPAAVEQDEKSQSLVWVSTPQRDNLCCFLFYGTITVGLTTPFAMLNCLAYPTCKMPARAKKVAYQVVNKHMYASSSCCQAPASPCWYISIMAIQSRFGLDERWIPCCSYILMILPYVDDQGVYHNRPNHQDVRM